MATQRDAATAHSPFFTVLPPEVRDAILTAAFGGRTLHIQRCYPDKSQAKAQGSKSAWARGNARQWLGRLGLFATSKSRGKEVHGRRWYACICDRDDRKYDQRQTETNDSSPTADNCFFQFEKTQWRASLTLVPAELDIGAMGWLLVCRQALHEGIKVLYASNTFHIRSRHLDEFGGFIPQIPEIGLSYITSLELVLAPNVILSSKMDVATSQTDILESTLSRIANLMPKLQRLYLGLSPWSCLRKDCASGVNLKYDCSKYFTSLLETTVRDLQQAGRSCELELGLPKSVYDQYLAEAQRQPSILKVGSPYWKPGRFDHSHLFSRMRFFSYVEDQRLLPTSENGVGTGTDVGYWMSVSMMDYDRYTIHDL